MKSFPKTRAALSAAVICALTGAAAVQASSHREAPFITQMPKVDGTDFYMFRSYEPGREDYVTLIANYQPLQDPYGGPNYFALDQKALYEIHIEALHCVRVLSNSRTDPVLRAQTEAYLSQLLKEIEQCLQTPIDSPEQPQTPSRQEPR